MSTIESEGSVELQVDSNGKAWINNGSDLIQINRNDLGGHVSQDRGWWKVSAAETINGTNYVVDASPDRIYVWEMDNNWNFVRNSQTATPGSSAYNTIEINFNVDFNDDGEIGINDDYAENINTNGKVELNDPEMGDLEIAGDHDWFAITLTAGKSYQFDVLGINLDDPYLYFRSSNGSLISSDDNSGAGKNSRLFFNATSSATTNQNYYEDGFYFIPK